MKWIRTFPRVIPRHRSYVSDQIERVYIRDYDFRPLLDMPEDIIMLEWDIVLSYSQMCDFEERISQDIDRVRVLPYKLPYHLRNGEPVWAHRHADKVPSINDLEPLRQNREWVTEGDDCELFGFGAVYIPQAMLEGFRTSEYFRREQVINDHHFSAWHWLETGLSVPIEWDIRPIHLHDGEVL